MGTLGVELGGSRGSSPGPSPRPTKQQNKIKEKDCFLGLCGLFFVLVFHFFLTNTLPRSWGTPAGPRYLQNHYHTQSVQNKQTEKKNLFHFFWSFCFVFSATFISARFQPRDAVDGAGDYSSASRFWSRELLALFGAGMGRRGRGDGKGVVEGRGKHFPKEKKVSNCLQLGNSNNKETPTRFSSSLGYF